MLHGVVLTWLFVLCGDLCFVMHGIFVACA